MPEFYNQGALKDAVEKGQGGGVAARLMENGLLTTKAPSADHLRAPCFLMITE